jgi:hypothetical protein
MDTQKIQLKEDNKKNYASQQSFAVREVEMWNRLPDWVRVEKKPDSVKRQLKKAMA